MAASLLVVTPQAVVGALIRQILEETGDYRVDVAKDGAAAISCFNQNPSPLAFLDMSLKNPAARDVAFALREIAPHIKFVIVSEGDPGSALDEIRPWSFLRIPFELPDLLGVIGEIQEKPVEMAGMSESTNGFSGAEPTWLQDVNRAAQHLTRLTLESSAQAALITRQNQLWAYAGQHSQSAAKELAQVVMRYWDSQKDSDLLRFVRLETTKAEHMLYATRLSDGVILALVFDAETPFSTIRGQAKRLAQSLSMSKVEGEELPGIEDVGQFAAEESESEVPSITSILSDVPPPDVASRLEIRTSKLSIDEPSIKNIGKPVENSSIKSPAAGTRSPTLPPPAPAFSRATSSDAPLRELFMPEWSLDMAGEEPVGSRVAEDLEATIPSKLGRPETPIRKPAFGEADQTQQHSAAEVAGHITLEPVSPALYNLTYVCLLLPRFNSHYLTGELGDNLSEWLLHTCVAFGWRLEFLAVRPEYLQWIVNVPPSTSPGHVMRMIRQQTSERIFEAFQRLKKENPSGDFWAPGYLIMGGNQPHPPQLVKDYIKQTRQRQGLSPL